MEGEREVEKDYCLFVRERERERENKTVHVCGRGGKIEEKRERE